ncbi:TcpE family conjugal transfer membrane protein [Lentibacillus cibarius]|uniref:Conjugal transfer protein n=1 Tax=Lentibacillus cibarius TaxID=2583219 RepID=A0A5S3QKA0_9BACI|nr:TcpE family conjugal transfer membrane protein [Lentibacillus cibarius]TMN20856.1 hypothetical protein FFL34_01060 [Lentibacillus cibarius]
MKDEQNKRIPLYVLNNFLKFDRKIYQLFGLKLGRPIPFKGLLYLLAFSIGEIIWLVTPVLGQFIRWIPDGILILLPITMAWLLTDVGTEGRSPIYFFRSFLLYHVRQIGRKTYVHGRKIPKERTHIFHSYYTYGVKKHRFKPTKHRYKGFVTFK